MDLVEVRFPSGARVFAELATRPDEIRRGLMGRTAVPDGTGMLFDMGATGQHRFWMVGTFCGLDLVFLSPEGVVVGIIPRAIPLDPTLLGVSVPSRYVLEVPGGWCARSGVAVGQQAGAQPVR